MRSLVFPILFFPLIFLCIVHLRISYLSLLFSGTLHSVGFIFLFFLCFSCLLFLAICKASSDNHFAFLHFFFFLMVLVTASYTVVQTPVHSFSGTLSNLILWICWSLPFCNHKGFDLGYTWMISQSVMSDSLQPHALQHASLPCPSLSPGVRSNSCPLSWKL